MMKRQNNSELFSCGECIAPRFDERWGCQKKIFCGKIAKYPPECKIDIAYMSDNLDSDTLQKKFIVSKSYNRGKNIIVCSCQVKEGIVGFRRINIDTSFPPQAYSDDLFKDAKLLKESPIQGLSYVRIHNNERYIVFVQGYDGDVLEDGMRTLRTNYRLFDGAFYIIDRKNKKLYRAKIVCDDYKEDEDKVRFSLKGDDDFLVRLYRYCYVATKLDE